MDLEKKYFGKNFIGKSFEECVALIDCKDVYEIYDTDLYILYKVFSVTFGFYYGVPLTLNFSDDLVCNSYEWGAIVPYDFRK